MKWLLFLIALTAPASAQISESQVNIRGATNDTLIGNVSDRLKVDAVFTVLPTVTANQGTQGTNTSPWYVNLRNAAGTEVGTSGAPLRVDPTGTTTQPVSAASLPLPSGAATSANQTTEITALQIIDNIAHADNVALVNGVPIMGQLDDTSTAAVTENNVAPVRVTAKKALHVNLRDSTGSEFGVSANPIESTPQYQGAKLAFDDMNAGTGGVARATGITSTTVYTVLYNYTGSGQLFAFLVGFEGNLIGADNFNLKLEIDGVTVFIVDTNDIGTGNLYNLNTVGDEVAMGFSLTTNVLRFAGPRPGGLYFASSVKVSIKKGTSATSKQFRAGAVYLMKDS